MQNKIVMGIPVDSLKFAMDVFNNVPKLTGEERSKWEKIDKKARKSLGGDRDVLKGIVESAVELIQKTLEGVSGISFDIDKRIGTDRVVFAIHGPNMGKYGDAEVAIVFRPEISRHPDTFMTPIAAMGYYQGWYVNNSRVGTDRPWAGPAKAWDDRDPVNSAKGDYKRSKFHVTTRGWSDACAMEWISRVVQNGRTGDNDFVGKTPQNVTLRDVQKLWYKSDPHTAIEAHLPGFISLDLVERVYIANSARRDVGDAEKVLRSLGVVVEYVDDTRDAVKAFMEAPPHQVSQQQHKQLTMKQRGYDFYVEEGGKEHVVPIDLGKVCGGDSGKVIRFAVVNHEVETNDLMITFSDRLPRRGSDDPSRKCTSFALYPFSQDGYFFEGSPEKIVRDSTDLTNPVEDFLSSISNKVVYYTLVFDRDAITLRKSGISSVFNSNAMKIPRGNSRFISFSSRTFPCYVNNNSNNSFLAFSYFIVFLCVCISQISNLMIAERSDNDSKAASRTKVMQVDKKSMWNLFSVNAFGGAEPPSSSSSSSKHHQSQQHKNGTIWGNSSSSSSSSSLSSSGDKENPPQRPPKPGSLNQSRGGSSHDSRQSTNWNEPGKPVYCDNKYECQKLGLSDPRERERHISQCIHVCRYGSSCRYKDDPIHKQRFYHYKKEYCRYGKGCKKLHDPRHRATYHHEGLWDWMVKCDKGPKCSQKHDEKHCLNYTHENTTIVYPDEVLEK